MPATATIATSVRPPRPQASTTDTSTHPRPLGPVPVEPSLGRAPEAHERTLLSRAGIFRWGDPGTDAWCSDINPLADGVMSTREALQVAADSVELV